MVNALTLVLTVLMVFMGQHAAAEPQAMDVQNLLRNLKSVEHFLKKVEENPSNENLENLELVYETYTLSKSQIGADLGQDTVSARVQAARQKKGKNKNSQ